MKLKLLVDMNLSPLFVEELARLGVSSVHWSSIGDPRAADREIMEYARCVGYVVLTHDLDFGTLLALTHASGPSVIQSRGTNIAPSHLAPRLVPILRRHEAALLQGALLVMDDLRSKLRILPLQ